MRFQSRYNGQVRWTIGKDGWDVLWVTAPVATIAGAMLGEFAVWCRHA